MNSIYKLPLYVLGDNENGNETLLYPQIHYTKWITKIEAALFRSKLKYRSMFEPTDKLYNNRRIYQSTIVIYSDTIPSLILKLEPYEDYAFLYDLYNSNYFQPWLGSILNFLPFENYDTVVVEGLVLIRIPDTLTNYQQNDIENLALYHQLKVKFTSWLEESYQNMTAVPREYISKGNIGEKYLTVIQSNDNYKLVRVEPTFSPALFSCNTLAELVSKLIAGFPLTLRFGKDTIKESLLDFPYDVAYEGRILVHPTTIEEVIKIQKTVFAALNYRDNFNQVGIQLFYNTFTDSQEASEKLKSKGNSGNIQHYLSTIRPYRLVGRLTNLGFQELNEYMDALKALKQK